MHRDGFTLIELSIVLVIITLVAGGVLVGRELIAISEINGTISQKQKYDIATNAFRLKYNAFPGDVPSSNARGFSLFGVTGGFANTIGFGNGDGILQGHYNASYTQGGVFSGEVGMFFLHLAQAGLVEKGYGYMGPNVIIVGATATGGSTTALPTTSANATAGQIAQLIPAAKVGKNNYFAVGSLGGVNYYALTGITTIDTGHNVLGTNQLTPEEAYTIDRKIDDGKPGTGTVRALNLSSLRVSSANGTGYSAFAANNCVNSGEYYMSNSSFANANNCSLRFEFQ